MDQSFFDTMSASLWAALPEGVHQTEEALTAVFKDILTEAFSRLDLVTREEFDVQKKVLARTREKVAQLEGLIKGSE